MSDLETDASPMSGAEVPRPDRKDKQKREKTYQQRKDDIRMDDKGRLHYSGSGMNANITMSGVQNLQIGSNNVMFISGAGNKNKKCSATKPLSKSEEELSSAQHRMVSQELGRDWRKLGRALGLTDGQLDHLKADFGVEGQKEISHQMIRKWQEEKGEQATVAVVAQALDGISRGDIADKLHD